ncbi:MAG: pentapeptide repeat-containing protein [Deltaproteobacteria bacterium]|nr:pentapeptide repeat-containing protein [Deltaproteobacteria bacterium]
MSELPQHGMRAEEELRGLVAMRRLRARQSVASLARYRRADGAIDASGAVIDGITIAERELVGSRFAGAYLRDVFLCEARLDGTNAALAVLVRADLGGSSLRGACLRGALLDACALDGADLADTDWTGAAAFGCTLTGASFAGARLDDALFVECDLRNADLTLVGPHVGARFARCDLRGARLHPDAAMFVGCRGALSG